MVTAFLTRLWPSQPDYRTVLVWTTSVIGVSLVVAVLSIQLFSDPPRTQGALSSAEMLGYYGAAGPDGRQWTLWLRSDGTYQFNWDPHFPSAGQWELHQSPDGRWEIELESYGRLPIYGKSPPHQIRFCYGDPDVDLTFLKYQGKPTTSQY